MEPTEKAAWISASTALAVAVLGILGAIVAQLVASARANKSARDALERQAVQQREVLEQQAAEQRERTLLNDRRLAYAEVMRTMADRHRQVDEVGRIGMTSQEWNERAEAILDVPFSDEFSRTIEVVRLLAPQPVREAAEHWVMCVRTADVEAAEEAYERFVDAARVDVGAQAMISVAFPGRRLKAGPS